MMSLIRIFSVLLLSLHVAYGQDLSWKSMEGTGDVHPRHENAFVELGGKYYLLGGRGFKPVDIFDPLTKSWTQGKQPPIELHHFQAVSHEGLIYVIGALTGPYPYEIPVSHIYIYDPLENLWIVGPEIPQHRRRGAAGLVVTDGKFYLVCGIINGHTSHWVPWLDEYDPQSGSWRELTDAPRARDHFQAAVANGKLYAAGGRNSGYGETPFQATIPEVDVYDFRNNSWTTLDTTQGNIPTLRAGCTSVIWKDKLLVIGGESPTQKVAHNEVEALDLSTNKWENLSALRRGRHGSQVIRFGEKLIIAGGCGNRGGNPELTHMEVLGNSMIKGEDLTEIKRGNLGLESMDIGGDGKTEIVISNQEGNQALILASAATDLPAKIQLPVKLPFILSPGASLSLTITRELSHLPYQLLIKTYGKSAPLLVDIP